MVFSIEYNGRSGVSGPCPILRMVAPAGQFTLMVPMERIIAAMFPENSSGSHRDFKGYFHVQPPCLEDFEGKGMLQSVVIDLQATDGTRKSNLFFILKSPADPSYPVVPPSVQQDIMQAGAATVYAPYKFLSGTQASSSNGKPPPAYQPPPPYSS